MNAYQKEQWEALTQIRRQIDNMTPEERGKLDQAVSPYLGFRHKVDGFLQRYFADHCSRSCFQSDLSACCSKDGIITFWADIVINALSSTPEDLDILFNAVCAPRDPHKCIYLGPIGCHWRVRPLVCAMFLCDQVQERVLLSRPELERQWHELEDEAKAFRWPDRPVLFDHLEQWFIDAGCRSTLMYLNSSPGLLRIKQKAGLPSAPRLSFDRE